MASRIRKRTPTPVRNEPNITVIGFGDVVRERILPALRAMYQSSQLAVAADHISTQDQVLLQSWGIKSYSAGSLPDNHKLALEGICDFVSQMASYAIVAVPTRFHLDYARVLHRQNIRFAIEKPIVFSNSELGLVREQSASDMFSNAFVMSYYWLEKALPLNYFLTLNPRIRQLITTDWEPQKISLLHQRLGALRNIAISFEESGETERRIWTEVKENGGMVGETLIHPLTLMIQLAHQELRLQQQLWKYEPELSWFRNAERARQHPEIDISATSVEITGELTTDVKVFIRCGKYFKHKRRSALAEYDNGYVTMDLDEQVLRIFTRTESGHTQLQLTIRTPHTLQSSKFATDGWALLDALSTASAYAGMSPDEQLQERQGNQRLPSGRLLSYQLQLDLVNTFFMRGWGSQRFDDFPIQLRVIDELLQIAQKLPDNDQATQFDVDPALHAADADVHPLIVRRHLVAPHEYRHPQHFLLKLPLANPVLSPK